MLEYPISYVPLYFWNFDSAFFFGSGLEGEGGYRPHNYACAGRTFLSRILVDKHIIFNSHSNINIIVVYRKSRIYKHCRYNVLSFKFDNTYQLAETLNLPTTNGWAKRNRYVISIWTGVRVEIKNAPLLECKMYIINRQVWDQTEKKLRCRTFPQSYG